MKLTKLSAIFDISYGNGFELNSLKTVEAKAASVNFVARTSKNNGISARVQAIDTQPFAAGSITVAVGGSVLSSFLQPSPFYTAYHVMILNPKHPMSEVEKLYYCTCISKNKYRYSYGRQANKTLGNIEVPAKIPVWVSRLSTPNYDHLSEAKNPKSTLKIEVSNWKTFTYEELFDIKKGKRLTKANIKLGDTPFIAATEYNNGYRQFIQQAPNHEGNTITVNYNGSVGEAFYQPIPFWASDDVNILYPKFELTPYIGIFICTIIRQEKFKFSFGRKWHSERMKQSKIQLPTDSAGNPDWIFMENYIKGLPFSGHIQ